MIDWKGSFVALVTPFRNGALDEQALERLLDYQTAAGTQGVVPCATTGESPTILPDEYIRIMAMTLKKGKGKFKVLAYTGSNDTLRTITRTQEAEKLGVDGALVVTPYYNKPTQEGLYQHFKSVAQATKLPLMLYNVPSRTGVSLEPVTVARLAEINNIVAVKEASGDLDKASQIMALCGDRIAVFSGDDSLTLPMLAIGAKGVVSVLANVAPKDVNKMVNYFSNGKIEEARQIHLKQFFLTKSLFAETSPGPVKAALNLLGLCHAEMRMPLVDVSDDTRKLVKAELKKYGLLKQ
jgi:4-hydroxy-tetrahydrodipicolinate synthase